MSSLIALASALDQDYRDVGMSLPCIRLASSCFPPKSRLKFGLRSAIALLRASNDKFSAESQAERVAGQAGYRDVHGHCLQTVKQQCQCWAKLVKAYVACPSVSEEQINSGTMCTPDIPKPANGLEQPDILFAVLSGMFANRIQTLVSSVTWCDRQKLPTHTNFKQLLTQHLQLCSCLLKALHDIPSIRYTAEEIGLSYQDIEWFSRATMLRAVMLRLQVAVKRGGMKDAVAVQAVRHADRLIELAPDNPASYEFRAYAAMHSPTPAPDLACMYMQKAMRAARQPGDELGAAQYALQVMYVMLWKLSLSQNKFVDAAALEHELQQVLLSAGSPETIASLPPYEGMSPSSWQHAASVRLLTAAATVAKLAFAIPECPQQLLDYLQPFMARLPCPKADDTTPQGDKENETTNSMKTGQWTCNKSIAMAWQGLRRTAGPKQGHSSTVIPRVAPSGKERPSGCSSTLRCNMRSCTDQAARKPLHMQ